MQVEPPEDIEVPVSLLTEEEVANLVATRRPAYVPLARGDGVTRLPPADPATGGVPRPFHGCVSVHVWWVFTGLYISRG